MLDPVVHAALVALAAYAVNWLFNAIGLDLGSETYKALAEIIVAYVLSLFGYGLYLRATAKQHSLTPDAFPEYKPPFTQ